MKNKAFTLIELLLIIVVVIILASLILSNYRNSDKELALQRSAYKLAQDLRRVQNMAISSQNIAGAPPAFDYGFGIYFNTVPPDSYIIFADFNNNRIKDPGEDLEAPKLESKIVINSLAPASSFSIVFVPPDPVVWINGFSSGVTAQITLGIIDSSSSNKIISINNAGLIYIE